MSGNQENQSMQNLVDETIQNVFMKSSAFVEHAKKRPGFLTLLQTMVGNALIGADDPVAALKELVVKLNKLIPAQENRIAATQLFGKPAQNNLQSLHCSTPALPNLAPAASAHITVSCS